MKHFKTYQLALELYRKGQTLSLQGPIRDQFSRASLSVVLNLAEESGKLGVKEWRRFFTIAMGSLREVQACLEIANHHPLANNVATLGGALYRLLQNPGPGTPELTQIKERSREAVGTSVGSCQ